MLNYIMKQFSVIIPTMWRFAPFFKFLYNMLNHPCVGEVILIDNDVMVTPLLENHPKLRVFQFPKNIKVNPAWNLGAACAQFEHLLILNDDVLFDLKTLDFVLEFLEPGRLVMINLPHPTNPYVVTGVPRLVQFQPGYQLFHIGCMMYIHRNDWHAIPSGLELFHGDTWIWDYMLAKYNQNYLLENAAVFTPGSVTCNTFTDKEEINSLETQLYLSMSKFYIDRIVNNFT